MLIFSEQVCVEKYNNFYGCIGLDSLPEVGMIIVEENIRKLYLFGK